MLKIIRFFEGWAPDKSTCCEDDFASWFDYTVFGGKRTQFKTFWPAMKTSFPPPKSIMKPLRVNLPLM